MLTPNFDVLLYAALPLQQHPPPFVCAEQSSSKRGLGGDSTSPNPPLCTPKPSPCKIRRTAPPIDPATFSWYNATRRKVEKGLRGFAGFMRGGKPAVLLRKETLVVGAKGRLAVHTCTFKVPEGGQDLGVDIAVGDVVKVVVPGYKPKSYSMSSKRPLLGEFDITFKVYPGGRASPYLDSIKVGEFINVFPMGNKQRQHGGLVGVVAFGVGITEALPIARAELEAATDAQQVLLLWASRTAQETFWHSQFAELKAKHGVRFKVVTILSREKQHQDPNCLECGDRGQSSTAGAGAGVGAGAGADMGIHEAALHGRIDDKVLQTVFDEHWGTSIGGENECARKEVRFLPVGTKDMMRQTEVLLAKIGYPMPEHALLRR